ncbi:MAG: hypothetical protein ACJ748_13995 [Flavisolibacter sp.]
MNDLSIFSEQEAAVAILFACALNKSKNLSQAQIEHLSRMLVLSSKFRESSLNELTMQALSLQSIHGSKVIIEKCSFFITDEFKETLFAMCCELMTNKGTVDDTDSEVLAMAALYLGLTVENMKMMLTTYLIRNRWNVEIIEQE